MWLFACPLRPLALTGAALCLLPGQVLSDEGHDLTLAEGLRRMLKKMAQTGAYSLNRLPSA